MSWQRYMAEGIGTFALVLVGCGAIMYDERVGGLGTLGIALVFGLIVTLMILTFARTSGAHINPAVTLALAVGGKMERRIVGGYILAQVIGALGAMPILAILFPDAATFGDTMPHAGIAMTLLLEVVMTMFLVLVILFCVDHGHSVPLLAVLVGSAVAIDAFFGGPFTGASMNPARSIAPAVASGDLDDIWMYILAPIVGGWLAAQLWTRTSLSKMLNIPGRK